MLDFEKKLNIKLQGNFSKLDHISYNMHYYGYSKYLNRKIFIKIFNDKKKFEKEKSSVLFMTDKYLTDFEMDNKFILVLKFINYSDIDRISQQDIYQISQKIAKLHKMKTESFHEKNLSEKIKSTLNDIKKRTNFKYLLRLVESFEEFFEIVDIESSNTQKVRLHGDFSLRNIKK
ncbi:hypothetical protein KG089_02155 [Carnobacteriaceae bacterium zg-ZUI252]|nr:hypothetical protein [Carnobacteriaceae bacterium zg-ZUI252]